MRGHARMRDKNEREIVDALRRAGATVTQLNEKGVPDLLVGYAGRTFLLEVKAAIDAKGRTTGGAVQKINGGNGILTAAQIAWWDAWRGAPAFVVYSAADALEAIGAQVGPS